MINFLYITWDVEPGIPIGSFTLHYYSLMWVCAFALGWYLMEKMFKHEGVDKKYLDPFFIYVFVGTILGMRLGEYLFYDSSNMSLLEVFLPIRENPNSSLLWGMIKGYEFSGFSGLASHGATLGIIISMLIFAKFVIKKPFLWVVDRLVIPVAIGGAFVRVGNFINSEIVGKFWDGPWAVRFPKISEGYQQKSRQILGDDVFEKYNGFLPRHPSQLYEALGYALLFVLIYYIYKKTNKKQYLGYIFGLFFIVLWSIRFFVEFLKEDQGKEQVALWVYNTFGIDWLNNGQLLSIPFILIGIYLFLTAKNRKYEA